MKKRFIVRLTSEERIRLEGMIKRGREATYRRRHAEVLLLVVLVVEGEHGSKLIDRVVAERTGFTRRTVEQIRERCVTDGLDLALERKKLTGRGGLVNRQRSKVRLWAGQELGIVERKYGFNKARRGG